MKIQRSDRTKKRYVGQRKLLAVEVNVIKPDGTVEPLDPRFDLKYSSPTGFQWGYGGSGPAQLAFAMLYDYTQDEDLAFRLHQDFKWKVIAGIETDYWEIYGYDIENFIKSVEPSHSS